MSGLLGGSITGGSKINYSDPDAVSEAFAATYISARLEEFIGPHMLGMCFDLFLLGVVLHQMITYCSAPNKDRLYVKCTVYWVFGMAVVTSCYGIYYTWHFFVNFGVYSTFFSLRRVAIYNPLSAAITLPVQAFYLERAYKLLHKNIWVYIVMVPILAATLVSYIGLTWVMFDINSIAEVSRAGPWFYAWDSTMLASDAVLTALILYGLSKAKTGWSNTDRVVSQAIRTSVEAQLPATVYALGFILTYSIKPMSQVIFFWTMQHTKIYVISLLAVLNFRTTFRLANSSHNEGPVSHETPRNPGLSDTATHNTYGMKDIEASDKGNDAARRPRFTVEINRAARNSFGGPGNHFVPIEDVNEDQK